MWINILRLFFLFLGGVVGYFIFPEAFGGYNYKGAILGLLFSSAIILIEYGINTIPIRTILGSLLGLFGGLIAAGLINLSFAQDTGGGIIILKVLLTIALAYLGMTLGGRFGGELSLDKLGKLYQSQVPLASGYNKILDTSVIIDGRIADLCETGFLEGIFIIPQFILHELQRIADSSDSLKRARGRRGLDVLHKIQKMSNVDVKIVEEDFPHLKEVDAKLVALAKMLKAKIVTNDLNLNKVAELQGVTVLNINELSNALKPIVLPGESMKVFVLKEGKEPGQGVAYLDDGTMIVVDEAKRCIGKNVEVTVTSVLQTTAGRMIFTKLKEEPEKEEYQLAKG